MIQTKLLESAAKDIFYKPKPVKVLHKTYRQLLGLDKPKKPIFVQSDNQNDDFLEKLLKEEEKQKKKINKKNHIKTKQSKKSQQRKKTRMDSQQTKKQTIKNVNSECLNSNKNESKQLKSNIKVIKYVKVEQNQKIMQNRLKNNGLQKSGRRYSVTSLSNRNENANTIKIDQSDSSPYVVTTRLKNSLNCARKSDGFKLLHESQKKIKASGIKITAKLNPQLHQIVHQFNQENIYPQFRAKVLTIKQLLDLIKISEPSPVRERSASRALRNKLFKSEQQEARFMKNLVTMKQAKYQIPSLL